jgi:hypothetical protein
MGKSRLSVRRNDIDMTKVLRGCIMAMIGISVAIFIVIICIWGFKDSPPRLLTFLAAGGASVLGGTAAGFLFGIPRTEKFRYKPDADHSAKDYFYSDNTNLEEISDWLTKIIVGLTLVKFRTILEWLHQASTSMSRTFYGGINCDDKCGQYYVFSYSLIILYLLAGGILAYMWTRINFSKILTLNRIHLRDIEMSKTEQAAGLRMLNKELTVSNEVGDVRGFAADTINSFKEKVKQEYQSRPVKDKTDLQKERWGGKRNKNNFLLDADVEKQFIPGLFSLTLRITGPNKEVPYSGIAAFFLHDTFPQQMVFVKFGADGIATLELTCYEAFTVGAYLEDGTDLEMDLNDIPGFPSGFYWNK